ncbi:hypothetical protein CLAIMM_08963 isoform 2 [Cladophialophora immunda]|nr:hypothetical protein CLAIMM_08963 isoform 2 [Cladophialophora immunda]
MLHPETNTMTPYEEVWRTLSPSFTEHFPSAWILRSVDGRTFLGQLGGDFLALKGGSEGPAGMTGFCARREIWDDGKAEWTTKYEAGDEQNLQDLPSAPKVCRIEQRSKRSGRKAVRKGTS